MSAWWERNGLEELGDQEDLWPYRGSEDGWNPHS